MKGDYIITVIRRDNSKTYKNVNNFEVKYNIICLFTEDSGGCATRKIIPLFNVEEIEISKE